MALDITGIKNEREFYTEHYVTSALEDDLRPTFSRWAEMETSPLEAVIQAGAAWEEMRAELATLTDIEARLDCQRAWLRQLVYALGYKWQADVRAGEDGTLIPIVGEIKRADGTPELWLMESVDAANELADPLTLSVVREQLPPGEDIQWTEDANFEDILADHVFTAEEPPRWIRLFHAGQLILIDRTKWSQRRVLRFHFDRIFSTPDGPKLLLALAGAESAGSRDGSNLIDRLDEGSHKHAAKVSQDLKYSAREAIELIGNETLFYLRSVLKEKVYGVLDAEDLSRECLRYLYRLLFLFYVEARPQLGYAPMDSEEYRTGYSLESLRELALAPLETEESRNGLYLDASIRRLFDLVYKGFTPRQQMVMAAEAATGRSFVHTFEMKPLQSDLFDDSGMPTLARIRFRNHVLQRVLELLGYSQGKKTLGRGRISYKDLGINQLGAV